MLPSLQVPSKDFHSGALFVQMQSHCGKGRCFSLSELGQDKTQLGQGMHPLHSAATFCSPQTGTERVAGLNKLKKKKNWLNLSQC